MEESPYFFSSPEDDDEDDEEEEDATSRKRRRSAEIILSRQEDDEKKQKAGLDIGRSLFERAKEKEQESDEEADDHPVDAALEGIKESLKTTGNEEVNETATNSEKNPTELSDEEIVYVNQTIASDHLEHPVTEDEPEKTVTDFLELVVDGTDPEDAYKTTVTENELREDTPKPIVIKSETTEPEEENITSTQTVERRVYTQRVINNENLRNSAPTRQASKEKAKTTESIVKTVPISEEIVRRVVKKQADKQEQKRVKVRPKQIERQVQQMEETLSSQEQTIQRLTKENRVRMRHIVPAERVEPSKVESRLNLTKPERLERIGKVVISAEKPKTPIAEVKEKVIVKEKQTIKEKNIRPNNLRQYFRPEEVKTMRREDLMIVSEKIVVEGANLKDMYDNNLFSERALRRLVSEYLKGKDIRPLLRKEIVEKEMDYERDPILRDRDHTEEIDHKNNRSLFDKMLSTIELPAVSYNTTIETKTKKDKSKTSSSDSPKKHVAQPANNSLLVNGVLLFFIIILILLSIYLLLHKF